MIKHMHRYLRFVTVFLILIAVSIILVNQVQVYMKRNAVQETGWRKVVTNEEGVDTFDTVKLPLRFVSSSPFDGWKSGAGFLLECGSRILAVSRTGQVFDIFSAKFLYDLNAPNNLSEAFKDHGLKDHNSLLRIYSGLLNDDALFLSYQRYVAPNSSQFVVSKVLFDCAVGPQGEWIDIFAGEKEDRDSIDGTLDHAGKLLVEGDWLYFSTGNTSGEGKSLQGRVSLAQSSSSSFGKVFRYGLDTKELSQFAKGFRNVQGMTINNGDLYTVEHGPLGGDEINHVIYGGNYGWPFVSEGVDYGTFGLSDTSESFVSSRAIESIEPIYSFVPSVGLNNINRIKDFHTEWDGDFLLGALKSNSLYRVRIFNNAIKYIEPIPVSIRVRDLKIMGKTVYLLSDVGSILTMSVDEERYAGNTRGKDNLFDNEIIKAQCTQCHSISSSTQLNGVPSLWGVYGRKIASQPNVDYSTKLKSVVGRWNESMIIDLLSNPDSKYFNGIKMPFQALSPDQARDIAITLSQQ